MYFSTKSSRQILLSSHDIRDGEVEADHLPRSMPNTDPLTVWTGHDHQLWRHSTSPEHRHFAIADDRWIPKFWVVDIDDPQLPHGILTLSPMSSRSMPPVELNQLTHAIGSPCVSRYGLVMSRTRSISSALYGLIETTVFPWKTILSATTSRRNDSVRALEVTYFLTAEAASLCGTLVHSFRPPGV